MDNEEEMDKFLENTTMSLWWIGYKELHRTSISANLGKIHPP